MTKETQTKLQLELFRLATKSVDGRVLKMIQALRNRYPGLEGLKRPKE